MAKKIYQNTDVLTATRSRISLIFDNFKDIQVSISGGKDSTVLLYLVLEEAVKRGRQIEAFFLDQEAEYQATIDLIEHQMQLPNVLPFWYQVECDMFNITSYSDCFLLAWGNGDNWLRDKHPLAIHKIDEDYPKRFYGFFPYLEKKNPEKAYLVGLRADESLDRYRAVTKKAGWRDVKWSTKSKVDAFRFYPIYDWTVGDIWKYISDMQIKYNVLYDKMYHAGYSIHKMRISNLIHAQSYKCLSDLPKFEPETYDKLCKRISGISTASRYAFEKLVYDDKRLNFIHGNNKLPPNFASWLDYRNFLLDHLENESLKAQFKKASSNKPKSEITYKQQTGQLLVCNHKNKADLSHQKSKKRKDLYNKWSDML